MDFSDTVVIYDVRVGSLSATKFVQMVILS